MQDQNSLKKRNDLLDIEPFYYPEPDLNNPERYYGTESKNSGKQQIFKLFSTLRKHWLLIIAINLLITSLVVIYEAQKPEYYKAEARVQVNNEVNPAAGSSKSSIIVSSNPGNDPAYFTTQLQIIEGSGLLRRVVRSTDLEHNEAFLHPNKGRNYTVWQNVQRMLGMSKTSNQEVKDKSVSKNNLSLKNNVAPDTDLEAEQLAPFVSNLKRNLAVAPVKDSRTANKETRLIEIEFTHNDPEVAAKVVNSIADIYVLQNLEQKVETNAAAGDFLQKRVAELQSLIRSGEERLINYSKSNQILSLDSNQNTVVQRLSDLNAKLGQAENDRISAEAAYKAAQQNPIAKDTAESKDPRTAGLETQLITLRQRLTLLKTEYTEDWAEVIQVRRQIEGIEKELQNSRRLASSTQMATLEQSFHEASTRERELRSNFQKQRAEVLVQNEAAINYRIIQQEIDTNKTLLDGLLQRSRETDVVLNGTPNNVLVVDRALVPRSPDGPQRAKNIIIAFVASLMIGVGLSFLLSWVNDTISFSDDLEADIGLPILGTIPIAGSRFARKLLSPGLSLTKRHHQKKNVYDLESFETPIITESYLHLRTYILLSTAGGPPKTILVTSGQPGEGKTVTALNLAKSLSHSGARVLLVDSDLRYPRLHTIHNLGNSQGLSTLLTTKKINHEMICEVIQKNTEGNMDILTSGPSVPNPANILGSEEMQFLLRTLATDYSHIVIDSPPVLYFADSTILSTFVNAVVLVARDKISSRNNVLEAKKMLMNVSAKVIGIVLNGVPLKNSKYYGYKYYKNLPASSDEDVQGSLRIT